MIILGIDPALNNVGYGLLKYDYVDKTISILDYGIFFINQRDKTENKLNVIYDETEKLIERYRVSVVGLEEAYHNPRMAHGGFVVREAIGVIKLASTKRNKPIYAYTPQQVKKEITGKGNANKLEVAEDISKKLDIPIYKFNRILRGKVVEEMLTPSELVKRRFDHISDALAIACKTLFEITEYREAE